VPTSAAFIPKAADAWIAVTEPDGWTETDTKDLKEHLSQHPTDPE
jgi:uncharacterized membrane protein